jgi:3-oxoacyl-[acyl-carrier-protein] synthase-3
MHVPDKVIPNAYFNERLGEDVDTWLRTNVEIYERRWCAEDESTADLCVAAAEKALQQASIDATDLNLIIIATDTPEFISPSTASVVQERLGAIHAGTFDINTACAGFVTGIDIASKYIQTDQNYDKVMVIGAYAMSKYLNMDDKKTVTLFADGAGAVILKAEENSSRGLLTSRLHTDGQYNEWMGIYAGGARHPISEDVVANKDHLLRFVRKFPKELNPQRWSEMTIAMCHQIGIEPKDIDFYLFTQININSIRATLDILEVPYEKTHTVMHNYGYTGSACVPMALSESLEQNKIKEGDKVCFISSGGGLAFAGAIFQF